MKFSEINYKRPELDHTRQQINNLLDAFGSSNATTEQIALIEKIYEARAHFETMSNVANIRHTLDTSDPFFEKEQEYFDNSYPIYLELAWLQAAEVLDFKIQVSTPPGYEVEAGRAGLHGTGHFEQFSDPMDAARQADLVTTDVWTSMGFEAENEERRRDFADWEVDSEMMRIARPEALFMHCLPVHRGEEVSAAVIDGPQSVIWDEAENRMHTQKALLEYLLLGCVEVSGPPSQSGSKSNSSKEMP